MVAERGLRSGCHLTRIPASVWPRSAGGHTACVLSLVSAATPQPSRAEADPPPPDLPAAAGAQGGLGPSRSVTCTEETRERSSVRCEVPPSMRSIKLYLSK